MKRYRAVAVLALLLGVGAMVYGGVNLLSTRQLYQEGQAAYEVIGSQVRASAAETWAPPPATPERLPIPPLQIDFTALKAINQDAVAWLYSPDTVIDYPVMQTDNYSYYLSHLPDGTVNKNGSLFIDYNNAADFSGQLTVIYGHHMKSGLMFGSLKGYKNQKYYEEHPYMYLYTEAGNYRLDLIYGSVIGAGQWRERAFMYEENLDALLAYAAHNTTFKSDVTYAEQDRIVVLSTCSYEFNDARYVVLGILRPEWGD